MLTTANTKAVLAFAGSLAILGGLSVPQRSDPNEHPLPSPQALADRKVTQLQAQVALKDSQLQSMQALISKHPLLNYRGPTEGEFIIFYNAKDDQPVNITVDHQHLSGGTGMSILTSEGFMLPGVPVVVQVSGVTRACLVDLPNPGNSWQRLTVRVQGKDQHKAVLHWIVPQ